MITNRFDLWDEEIFLGDKVRLPSMPSIYTVKYGNFEYYGTQRIGIYLESELTNQDIIPLAQAKTLIKIKE